jgi:hypothetical protein
MLYLGMSRGPNSGTDLNTLSNLRIELSAGRELVVPRRGNMLSFEEDGNPWPQFLQSRIEAVRQDTTVPVDFRELPGVGGLVSRLEIAREANHPGTESLLQQLGLKFPMNILSDADADWSLWAGHEITTPGLPASPTLTP